MVFKIFFEDLNDKVLSRIRWVLLYDLNEEIAAAVNQGLDRTQAENEIIDDYLNRHNTGITVKI